MSKLMLHCGGQPATLNDLREIPLPEETESYKPVSHYDLAINLAEVAGDMLKDYSLHNEQYGIAREGRQMFGVHVYKDGSNEMGLSIGFRNSYDKSMSVGIAIGASVFVCDNLALTGEVTVMRKHTQNVWKDLEETIVTTIYRSKHNFHRILADAELMKGKKLNKDEAYRMMGFLWGHGVLSPRQLPVAKREWLKPKYDEFKDRNLWSFYNACTEALKSTPPAQIMEKHIKLHKLVAEC